MDANTVISVRNVTKTYKLFDRHSDRVREAFHPLRRKYHRPFNALTNVSFEVGAGEVFGIIGRNGSGKSTLLQVVCGILQPTSGMVRTAGRLTALLELGAGFNPEYTGRENVFMYGSVMGFSAEEMDERFEEIALFADIGEFIDQKVKIYSSGMFVRLAFAVATCVQPRLLVVDEALSVGDVSFQHKCMRRIRQMVESGASVLLVSHGTDTVKRFCRRALWLEKGEARYLGEAGAAVENYLAFLRMDESSRVTWIRPSDGASAGPELQAGKEEAVGLPSERELPTLGNLDVSDPRLYRKGQWKLTRIEEAGPIALAAYDVDACVGFRFEGNRMTLRFLSHPWSGVARVILDGRENLVRLYRAKGHEVETVQFALESGLHSVRIMPVAAKNVEGREVWLLGGDLGRSDGRIPFKRDPKLGIHATEVERYGNGKGRLTAVELLDYESEEPLIEVNFGQKVRLRLHGERIEDGVPRVDFSFIVRDLNRIDLFGAATFEEAVRCDPTARFFVAEFSFHVRLGPGSYSILATFVDCSEDLERKVQMDQIDIAYIFRVRFDPNRPVWYVFHEPVDVRIEPYRLLDT